jgi:hypothetical protein
MSSLSLIWNEGGFMSGKRGVVVLVCRYPEHVLDYYQRTLAWFDKHLE